MATTDERPVQFTAGGLRLEGRLHLPPGATAGAVICHPHPQYGGTMDNNVVAAVATALQALGMATLRFNFRGVGASEGEHGGGAEEVIDARAAVAFLRAAGPGEITLAGYSFGAAVAARAVDDAATLRAAAARDHEADRVSRLVLIAPPLAFFSLDGLSDCRLPKLFIAGDRDDYCSLDSLRAAVAPLPEPKTVVTIPRADHFFSGAEDALAAPLARFHRETA